MGVAPGSPMVRSRLPLLRLFGALLMLSPEGLLEKLTPTPLNDPEMRIPLAVAVEKFNLEAGDSPNYYKVLKPRKAQYEDSPWINYFLEVRFVETTCEKEDPTLTYRRIQKCKRNPGNNQEILCYFLFKKKVFPIFEMKLTTLACM